MAERKCFIVKSDNYFFEERTIEFEYHKGFALSQKQKSIYSLHENILKTNTKFNVLEISTKSPVDIGRRLSAFNLHYFSKSANKAYAIENIFQSSKVFEKGGPYSDLLNVHPIKAKRDPRLQNSGKLICFRFDGQEWPLVPKSIFYDWIYVNALYNDKYLTDNILAYNVFTDIEFNHKKSINCQARAAAIFVSLFNAGLINDYINDVNLFIKVYQSKDDEIKQCHQLSFLPPA